MTPVLLATVLLLGPVLPSVALAGDGAVSGEVVDPVGRPMAAAPVALFAASSGLPVGSPLATTSTDDRGHWSFAAVEPGSYVVQLSLNGQVAGVPALVSDGGFLDGLLIVAPSVAAARVALQQDPECEDADGDGECDDGGLAAIWWVLIAAGAGLGVTLPFIGDDDES